MESAPNYLAIWAAYIVLGCLFLCLWGWVTRRWPLWLNVPCMTLIAAIMFTPGLSSKTGSDIYAPATIIVIFDGEQLGVEAAIQAGIPILISWLGLLGACLFALGFRHYKKKRKPDINN